MSRESEYNLFPCVELPPNTIKAIFFDWDDLVVDSGDLWWEAALAVARKYGCELPAHLYGASKMPEKLAGIIHGSSKDQLREEYHSNFRKCSDGNLRVLPGAVERIKEFSQLLPMAVVSSSPRFAIEDGVRQLGLDGCFQEIIVGRDVERGKPAPDIYLLAAQRLQVDPYNCLVIEDSVMGVTAANAAGMKCLAVPSPKNIGKPEMTKSDLIIPSLAFFDQVGLYYLAAKIYPPQRQQSAMNSFYRYV